MSEHAVDVIVSDYADGQVEVKVSADGFADQIENLALYVRSAEGVTSASVTDGKSIILASYELIYPEDSPEQVRIRIRNRCRDYFHATSGYLTNTGPHGIYVDLAEDSQFVT